MPHKLMEMVHKGADTYSALAFHPELKNKVSTQVILLETIPTHSLFTSLPTPP